MRDVSCIFKSFSNGVKTNRDDIVYGYDRGELKDRIKAIIENYNSEVDRLARHKKDIKNERISKDNIDQFVSYRKVNWSESLKANLMRGKYADTFAETALRPSLYRPYAKKWLYFDPMLNERRYQYPRIFPTLETEKENRVICVSGLGTAKPFDCLAAREITELQILGNSQSFPFYIYNENGANRRENVTDWALGQFREHYRDKRISKWDIFYYVYGILHHPAYGTKYADNLRRELPRIPYAPDFKAFSKAGAKLAQWHLEYGQIEPYKFKFIEAKDHPLSYHVNDKMRLSKDKKSLMVNPSLTLSGIPAETFGYRPGNRSALEWVIDQYQVKTDKQSGIRSDPNRPDDPEYIVRLVGQVIQVSLETVKIVDSLPKDFGG